MTTSPLIPVPDLDSPAVFTDGEDTMATTLTVLALNSSQTIDGHIAGIGAKAPGDVYAEAYVTTEDAPAVAAAILAAAGCDTHRVIDLGGLLPEVPHAEAVDTYASYNDGELLENLRYRLAVLEARATPQHDPAEVEAVIGAMRDSEGEPSWRETAITVLDALAAVRAAQ